MVRKILLGVLAFLLVVVLGVYVVFKTKGDVILEKFRAKVEEATGAPLNMEALPSLTVFPSPGLDIGKASWGKKDGDIFISFSRASVRVSGLALMSGDVVITSLEADDLDITLQPSKSAAKPDVRPATVSSAASSSPNTASPLPPPASPATAPGQTSPADPKSPDIGASLRKVLASVPQNLTANNARITLALPDGQTYVLSGASVRGKNSPSTMALNVQGSVAGKKPAFTGKMELDANMTLEGQTVLAWISKALFTPQTGLGFKENVGLAGEAAYKLSDGTLNVSKLNAFGPGMNMDISGTVNPLRSEAGLWISAKGSPAALLAALGIPVATTDPKALSRLELQTNAAFNKSMLRLDKLTGKLDDITVNGDLALRLEGLTLSGGLALGDIKLDGYLPPVANSAPKEPQSLPPAAAPAAGAPKPAAPKPTPSSGMPWPYAELDVRIAGVEAKGIRMDSIQAHIQGKGGAYSVAPLTFNALGGPISAPTNVVMAGKTMGPDIRADISTVIAAPKLDMAQVAELGGKKGFVSGTGVFNASLAANTASPQTTLSGKGDFTAAPLNLGVNLLPAGVPTSTNIRQLNKVTFSFEAAKGVINLTRCDILSPKATASGKGSISLPAQSMDIRGIIQVVGVAALPVRLQGPLASPSYVPDASNTVDAVVQTLEQRGTSVGKEVQRGLRGLFR